MYSLTWTNGDKMIRSTKNDKPILDNKEKVVDKPNSLENSYTRLNSRREEAYTKITERKMFNQTCQNPFLVGQDFSKVLDDQKKFLIPCNSNIESEI